MAGGELGAAGCADLGVSSTRRGSVSGWAAAGGRGCRVDDREPDRPEGGGADHFEERKLRRSRPGRSARPADRGGAYEAAGCRAALQHERRSVWRGAAGRGQQLWLAPGGVGAVPVCEPGAGQGGGAGAVRGLLERGRGGQRSAAAPRNSAAAVQRGPGHDHQRAGVAEGFGGRGQQCADAGHGVCAEGCAGPGDGKRPGGERLVPELQRRGPGAARQASASGGGTGDGQAGDCGGAVAGACAAGRHAAAAGRLGTGKRRRTGAVPARPGRGSGAAGVGGVPGAQGRCAAAADVEDQHG